MVVSSLLISLRPLLFSKIASAVPMHVGGSGYSVKTIAFWIGALVLTDLVQKRIGLSQNLLRERAGNGILLSMEKTINRLFGEKSLGQHTDEATSLNHTSIENARSRVWNLVDMAMFNTGPMVISVSFSYMLLWYLGWKFGMFATVLVCVHLSWSFYLNYHVSKDTDHIEKRFRAHRKQVTERWQNIERVKTSGKNLTEQTRLAGEHEEVRHMENTFYIWYNRQTYQRDRLINLLRNGVLAYGIYQIVLGAESWSILFPLYLYMNDLASNLSWVGDAEHRINREVPYIRNMRDSLMLPSVFIDHEGIPLDQDVPTHVEFRNVGLSYRAKSDDHMPVLNNISFTVRPGDKVALIGSSGAGKTSIMKLMMRYFDPTNGEILLNGVRLTQIRLDSWMNKIGYIAQKPQVFSETVRYNLTFRLSEEEKKSITEEELWRVVKLLHIDSGTRLEQGLDTRVGKDGLELSGGQVQRLLIGAAVIGRPELLVIDEATSALDSVTEGKVMEGLKILLGESVGLVVIAHRLSSVRYICNRFIVLRPFDPGQHHASQIEIEGTSFEKIYPLSPTFRSLADAQNIPIGELELS